MRITVFKKRDYKIMRIKIVLLFIISTGLLQGMSDALEYQKKYTKATNNQKHEDAEKLTIPGISEECLSYLECFRDIKNDGSMTGEVQHRYADHKLFPDLMKILQDCIENFELDDSRKQM